MYKIDDKVTTTMTARKNLNHKPYRHGNEKMWSGTGYYVLRALDELADALLSIARLSLIFDNAVFFVTGRCEDMQFGKICLKHNRDEQDIHPEEICLFTDSTTPGVPALHPSHRRLVRDPRQTCRMSQNPWWCLFSRTLGTRSKQSGPTTPSVTFGHIWSWRTCVAT